MVMTRDNKLSEEEIINLIRTRQEGKNPIYYQSEWNDKWLPVKKDHKWDFVHNLYKIKERRRFIVYLNKNNKYKLISDIDNQDKVFNQVVGCEYFYVDEVFDDEVE